MISIVLPIRNEGRWVDITLDSLFLRIPDKYLIDEIILVYDWDNQHLPITSSFDWRIKKLVIDKSRGPAYARNQGARSAKGDYILFLDSHIYWDFWKLSELVDLSKGKHIVGASISDLRNPDYVGNILTIKDYDLQWWWKYVSPPYFWVPSIWWAFIFTPKRVFEQIGWFNKYFIWWWLEDIEFWWRANMMGYKIAISSVKISHRFEKSFERFEVISEDVLFNKLVFWYLYLRTTRFSNVLLDKLIKNSKGLDIFKRVLKISKNLKKDIISKFRSSPSKFLDNNISYHEFLKQKERV